MARSYGYAVARIKALENRLLDQAFFGRMADSPSLETALKMLSETPYGAYLVDGKQADFDKAIDAELLRCYQELNTFVPDEDLVVFSRLIYDLHNVKVLVKGRMMASRGGARRLELLTPLGSVDTDALTLAVEGDEFGQLPFSWPHVLRSVMARVEAGANDREVERLLDHGYYAMMLELAEKVGLGDLKEWIRDRIDGDNLRALLRLSRVGLDPAESREYLIDGGHLDLSTLKSLALEPVETWSRALANTKWFDLLAIFAESGDFGAQLVRFEKELDDKLSFALASSKFDPFGPINVVRYLRAKEMEAKNLRLTLVSLANGVSKDTVRGLLRHVG